MNGSTNVQVVGFAGGAAVIVMWLLGALAPQLMVDAPIGLEAALTAVITAVVAWIAPSDAGFDALPGKE